MLKESKCRQISREILSHPQDGEALLEAFLGCPQGDRGRGREARCTYRHASTGLNFSLTLYLSNTAMTSFLLTDVGSHTWKGKRVGR